MWNFGFPRKGQLTFQHVNVCSNDVLDKEWPPLIRLRYSKARTGYAVKRRIFREDVGGETPSWEADWGNWVKGKTKGTQLTAAPALTSTTGTDKLEGWNLLMETVGSGLVTLVRSWGQERGGGGVGDRDWHVEDSRQVGLRARKADPDREISCFSRNRQPVWEENST